MEKARVSDLTGFDSKMEWYVSTTGFKRHAFRKGMLVSFCGVMAKSLTRPQIDEEHHHLACMRCIGWMVRAREMSAMRMPSSRMTDTEKTRLAMARRWARTVFRERSRVTV